MNRIVRAWNRHGVRPQQLGPDTVTIDEMKLTLVNSAKKEEKKMKDPLHKIGVNRGAMQELIFFGPDQDVANFKRVIQETFARLGIKRFRKVKPFRKIEPYKGSRPTVHDLMRLVDDISSADDPKYTEEIVFLKRLYLTILDRESSPPPVDEE